MFDVVCVGFGPANIALAVALDEIWPAARVNFVKRDPAPCWQRR
ncbi:SidA/IucD/PvdA family monooxygenase [Micromonospora sp. ATCC 39149]|uniref:L-lysine N6-monooxygenase MbtG n=1 Tax=Micromonospora carbonacea TaxID=47853 RepID=A0A7D5YKY9_9ACTN|nr:SidA/IucD/PvdA family monooxygenase [Micromonospora carbonacea]